MAALSAPLAGLSRSLTAFEQLPRQLFTPEPLQAILGLRTDGRASQPLSARSTARTGWASGCPAIGWLRDGAAGVSHRHQPCPSSDCSAQEREPCTHGPLIRRDAPVLLLCPDRLKLAVLLRERASCR